MRARMLVDAKVIVTAEDVRVFSEGQVIEGKDAELQVGLGHAIAVEGPVAVVEAPKDASSGGSKSQ